MEAPICLFTYNRLIETKQSIAALANNYLAPQSDLIIFSDGPKNEAAKPKVNAVRNYLATVDGFKSVSVIESAENRGLAGSVIHGVNQVLEKYGKVIVLEDDLITSPNFLNFMNQALDYYAAKPKIFSISGYGHKLELQPRYQYDVYLRGRNSSWGWATWLDRWETIDWEIKDWDNFRENKNLIKSFNANGSDLFKMLKESMEGKNSSWAIRFGYNQFKQKKLTVCPVLSKVSNNGFSDDATHTKSSYNRHKIYFDQTGQTNFVFTDDFRLNPSINEQLAGYNSISSRIKTKVFSYPILNKMIKQNGNVETAHQSPWERKR